MYSHQCRDLFLYTITATGAFVSLTKPFGRTKNIVYCPGFHGLFIFFAFFSTKTQENPRHKSIAMYDPYVGRNLGYVKVLCTGIHLVLSFWIILTQEETSNEMYVAVNVEC